MQTESSKAVGQCSSRLITLILLIVVPIGLAAYLADKAGWPWSGVAPLMAFVAALGGFAWHHLFGRDGAFPGRRPPS